MELRIKPSHHLKGHVTVPGDKSISHRALILGALAEGRTTARGWLAAGDTLATLGAVRALGVVVEQNGSDLHFMGGHLVASAHPIDCRNAGTCMRLLAGLLAGQAFSSVLDGSEQLRARPMTRITQPLQAMGADVSDTKGRAPLMIHPATLRGTEHQLQVASAQVKSAILLAGLQSEGKTIVNEPGPSRDHTERMLQAMGADLSVAGNQVSISRQTSPLQALNMTIPGDISSAAFLLVAAVITSGSDVTITGLGLNPTRTGIIDILRTMGADLSIEQTGEEGGEPVGNLRIRSSELQAAEISGDVIVRAIDELPILAVAATQAQGQTLIRDAAELRVKEVDRIAMVIQELRKLGADIEERPDGMVIQGPTSLKGAAVDSHGDHRLGMALAVSGLVANGETLVQNAACIEDSFPCFGETLVGLGSEVG